MKFRKGDKVRTTKGDRFSSRAKFEELTVVQYKGYWRAYRQVLCQRRDGRKTPFLEKNLVKIDATSST